MDKQKFEFSNYDVEVEIAGQTFTMDCSSDSGDYFKQIAVDLKKMATEISMGTKTADDAVEYGLKAIDHLLGDGAAEKVFANRKRRLSDVTDVCLFLTETANKFHAERAKIAGNRALRRTKKNG